VLLSNKTVLATTSLAEAAESRKAVSERGKTEEALRGYCSVDVRQLSYWRYLELRICELSQYKYALRSAVMLNLKRRYRRSTLGFGWSLLNPLLSMGVLSLVFGGIFHQNYQSFSIYVFSALLPWNYIAQTTLQGTESLVNNESYIKRVAIPKAFFPLVTVCTELLNFVLSLVSFLALGLLLGAHYSWALLSLPLAVMITGILAFGLAIFMAVLTVYWRDLQHIVGILLQLLFYTLPIIYPMETLSQPLKSLVVFNPFYHFVKLFRLSIYADQWPSLADWGLSLLIAVIILAASLCLLRHKEREIVFRL
jgi:ABC-type polysaccharide/polyol phosphate export permease